MTPLEKLFWQRLQRRVAGLSPEIARAVLKAFAVLRDSVSEAEYAAMISRGDVEAVVRRIDPQTIDRAFAPVRRSIYDQVVDGVIYHARDIPKAQSFGLQFNVLNPRMVDAVRALDTKVVEGLTEDVRQILRQVTERGITAGVNPRAVARELRAAIGLGPAQESQVDNFRRALVERDVAKIKTYLKRDRRFDSRIERGDYGDAEIEKWTGIYRKRRIAQNAETNAITAALDAQKLAQRMAWESAIERGLYAREDVLKRWSGTLDERERELHLRQEGETVGFDEPFTLTGEIIPGQSTYRCRCSARYSVTLKRRPPKGVGSSPQQLAAARLARQMGL